MIRTARRFRKIHQGLPIRRSSTAKGVKEITQQDAILGNIKGLQLRNYISNQVKTPLYQHFHQHSMRTYQVTTKHYEMKMEQNEKEEENEKQDNTIRGNEKKKVIILGSTGSFGRLVLEMLSHRNDIEVIPTSRSKEKLKQVLRTLDLKEEDRKRLEENYFSIEDVNVQELKQILETTQKQTPSITNMTPEERNRAKEEEIKEEKRMKHQKRKTKETLQALLKQGDILINTMGPFHDLEYSLIKQCIKYNCHYIDLADTRDYVANIGSALNREATTAGVSVIVGASTVPSITEALISKYEHEFDTIQTVDIDISPGNKAIRGLGTIQSVTKYAGKPFTTIKDGKTKTIYGWDENERKAYPGFVAKRPVANVEVPDHTLYLKRFPTLKNLNVKAGVELSVMQYPFLSAAWLVKKGLISNDTLMKLTPLMYKVANLFKIFGSDRGLLHIDISGTDNKGQPHVKSHTLIARSGDGPYIPIIPALLSLDRILDKKAPIGAYPCMGVFTYDEFRKATSDKDYLDIVNGISSKASSCDIPPQVFAKPLERPYRPLWKQLIGERAWMELPEYVRNFHAPKHYSLAECQLTVTRHPNWLIQKFLDISLLPKSQVNESCRVVVDANDLWIRRFEKTPKHMSSQWIVQNGAALETFLFTQFQFDLKPISNHDFFSKHGMPEAVRRDIHKYRTSSSSKKVEMGFVHEYVKGYVMLPRFPRVHIPFPSFMKPKVFGCTIPLPHREAWYIDVNISLPLIGQVIRYEGIVTPKGEFDTLIDKKKLEGHHYEN